MTGHNSEFVAASLSIPDPASHPRHLYCPCGVSYTVAHAFHAHCKRTGHIGDWSRSKYQPKGHGSMTADADFASDASELPAVVERAVLIGDLAELPMSNVPLPAAAEPFNSDDSGVGSSIDGKEADAFDEADIQAHLLSEQSYNSNDDDNEEVKVDHTQVVSVGSTVAPPLGTRETPSVKSTSLAETIADPDVSNVINQSENGDANDISNTVQRLSKSLADARRLIHAHRNKDRVAKSNPIQASDSDRARSSVTRSSGKKKAAPGRLPRVNTRRSCTIVDRLRRAFNASVRKLGASARTIGKSVARHKGELSAALISAAVVAAAVRCLQNQPVLSGAAPTCQRGWLLDLNTSTHVVKDSGYYSNVDSVLNFDTEAVRNGQ